VWTRHCIVDAIFNLAAIAFVLPLHDCRGIADLAVPHSSMQRMGLRAGMIDGHQLLAAVSQLCFIPHEGFEESSAWAAFVAAGLL
jgi:hypothetical protein